MAVWQFSIDLVPKEWAVKNEYSPLAFYSKERSTGWGDVQTNRADVKDVLTTILPLSTESWGNSVLLWGETSKHDIKLYSNENMVSRIIIRLHTAHDLDALTKKIVDAAKQLDCVFFFASQFIIVDASLSKLREGLSQSSAILYFKDEKAFRSKLNDEKRKIENILAKI